MNEFIRGFSYLFSGFALISKPGIRKYVLIPTLVNIILFSCAILFGIHQLDDFMKDFSGWWQWLEWLLWPLFILVTMTIVFFTFSILANLIAAPFNGFLAETVESHLDGKKITSSSVPLSKEIIKAIASEISKFLYFLVRAIPLLILLFIPGLQLLWILFGAWMLALEYLDFPMSNHGMTFKQERLIIKQHRRLALGFGSATMLMALIPVINFIVMPVAVCGATKLWVNEFKKNEQKS